MLTTFWALLFNGFVGFQWIEDGTALSLWSLRLSSLLVFGLVYFISIATFLSKFSFSKFQPTPLWIFYFIFSGLCILGYVVLQTILVLTTLEDRWVLSKFYKLLKQNFHS
jgi:hypothetical protein